MTSTSVNAAIAPVESPATSRRDWLTISLLGAVVLFAVALRAWLLFSTPLVPGMNGAYYLVQTRSLIEAGHLGIPDLPLTFVLQAVLSKIVQFVSGWPLEQAVVFGVKLADSILPALVALPVFALVQRWAKRKGAGIWLSLCAALALAAGAPALSMVGDFQKNELGLVWLAALLWRLHVWFDKPDKRNAGLVILFLALVGLTHIGVFGWALALTMFTVAMGLLRGKRETLKRVWPWLLVAGGVCGLVAGLVLWKFDPQRVQRLVSAIAHPTQYLAKGNGRPGNMPGMPNRPNDFKPQDGSRNGPPGMPGMGKMPFGAPMWFSSAMFCTLAVAALLVVWVRRKILTTGDVALITGCALGLLVLSGPWVTGDKVMRFTLIAVSPAVVCAAFMLLQVNLPRVRLVLGVLGALALLVPGVMRTARGGQPIITQEAAAELQALSSEVTSPGSTLIVARHGLEWWTAWYLHTHIAHVNVLTEADWTKFDHVYFLRQKGGMQRPGGQMPGRGQRPPEGRDGMAGDFPPPGDFMGDFPPPGEEGRPFPRRGPAGGGAMGEPAIPHNADITREGKYFTLALVPEPVGIQGSQQQAFRSVPHDEFP